MIEAKDIRAKIEVDFANESKEAFAMLDRSILKASHLNDDRIIRCIVFLAKGDLQQLNIYIQAAKIDPRDVIYWAEYIHHNQPTKTRQVHDFSRPFEGENAFVSKQRDDLVEFTHEIWNSWRLSGYTYIRYRRIDENAVALKPFREVDEDAEEMYTFFEIGDDEVRVWADNNDPLLENFEFLVEI